MTDKEVIKLAQGLITTFKHDSETMVDFCNTVVKKFEQPPCEDECISKTEVINTIHKITYGFFDIADDGSEEPMNDKDKLLLTINKAISNAVKALPSVTPSRPRGKWIHWTNDYKDYVTCSCCEYGEEGEVLLSDKTPFCPICGADMRESEDK